MIALQQPVTDRMPTDRQRLALEGFFGIMQRWGLDNSTARRILGSPPERTFFEWKKGKAGRVPEDTLRRIGYVAGHLEGAGDPLFRPRSRRRLGQAAQPRLWRAQLRSSAWRPAT